MTDPAPVYTVSEAVQVRIGNRWRNGDVKKIKPRGGFIEITVEITERGEPAHLLVDAASELLRKHGVNVIAKERPPMKGWKRKPARRRYRRVMPGGE